MEQTAQSSQAWVPETDAERSAIREQLERILASPLFKNSKRYPNLLKFVVERALQGHTEPLKERTLGIEVFGREPDYDTNLDPVVRTTAVEIRKRIAQYYHEAGHETEIRIDFPPGTYMPEFRMPAKPAVVAPISPVPAPKTITTHRAIRKWMIALAALCIAIGAVLILASGPWAKVPPIEQFWAPVLSSSDPVTIYIGHPADATSEQVATLMDLMKSERVAFADASTMARLSGLLAGHNKTYHLRLQTSANVEDLKDGSSILIGAFNNTFTLRLTSPLRFSFALDPKTHLSYIRDSKNPGSMEWSHDANAPYANLTKDYAVISRLIDPTTGRWVVTASGLSKYGTEAAGEFLTSPAAIEELSKVAPKDWGQKNMQIVIEMHVVGRAAGPAHIIDSYFW